jgi:hypothetical protein
VREAPAPARQASGGRTVLGLPWPLPVSPLVAGLVLLLVVAAGAAWLFDGRFETTPAEAAKRLLPYRLEEIQKVVLTSPTGSVTYMRDGNGVFSTGAPAPAPTPVPPPDATPGPVVLPPSTQLEGMLGQLSQLTIDRVVEDAPSRNAEYGLDSPQLTVEVTPKSGAASAIAIGQRNPDGSAYYVRRESNKDTVLASRYTLDDLMKIATDLIVAT